MFEEAACGTRSRARARSASTPFPVGAVERSGVSAEHGLLVQVTGPREALVPRHAAILAHCHVTPLRVIYGGMRVMVVVAVTLLLVLAFV